ncbi:MAG: (deoxy)nucleoside triphosphate pyrophosphohydrolase [Clostridia bacterium]|nr:(deoxy)nucleoside triphosphate pyrophosphohydrolase [Clostridia bacterium]
MASERLRLVVAAAVVERAGKVMLCQRKADVHNALKWEFPGGKLEAGESPEEALARELHEELGIRVRVERARDVIFHRYPDRDVLVLFYGCTILRGEPRSLDCNAIAWATPGEMGGFDFAGADRTFVERNML